MPEKSVEEITKVLTDLCKTFGTVTSMSVKLQKDS
jgi:hypothetical protein